MQVSCTIFQLSQSCKKKKKKKESRGISCTFIKLAVSALHRVKIHRDSISKRFG